MKRAMLLLTLLAAALSTACGEGDTAPRPAQEEAPLPALPSAYIERDIEPNTRDASLTATAPGREAPLGPQATEEPFRLFTREEIAQLQAERGGQLAATEAAGEPAPSPTDAANEQGETPQSKQLAGSGQPAGKTAPAMALPYRPQLAEGPTLQEIYSSMDLSIYALNPNEPLEAYGGISSDRPFEEYRDHPYLHMFPSLETTIESIQAEAEGKGQSHPKTFQHHLYENKNQERIRSTPLRTYGVEQFLAHPWFDPLTGYELGLLEVRRSNPDFGRGHEIRDIGPPYFGKDSLREIMAQTVGTLLEGAILPEAEPFALRWGQVSKHGFQGPLSRLENPARLSDYIRRPYVPEDGIRTLDQAFRAHGSYTTPKVRWDFLDPALPIIKVAVTVTDVLPLRGPETTTQTQGDGTELKVGGTRYTVAFVVAFQNRWSSFENPNRWIVRFREHLQPIQDRRDFKEGDKGRIAELRNCPSGCIFTKEVGALDPNMDGHWPNYWHASDYMHHSIIGPVMLTVHESTVLQPGTYAAVPRVSQWEAPGPIVPTQGLMTPSPGDNVERNFIQMYPYPQSPNPGFPLPGHLLADAYTKPGSDIWEEYKLGPDWN